MERECAGPQRKRLGVIHVELLLSGAFLYLFGAFMALGMSGLKTEIGGGAQPPCAAVTLTTTAQLSPSDLQLTTEVYTEDEVTELVRANFKQNLVLHFLGIAIHIGL